MKENRDLRNIKLSFLIEQIKENLEKITKRQMYIVFVSSREVADNSRNPFWRIKTEKKYGLNLCTIFCDPEQNKIGFNVIEKNNGKNYSVAYSMLKSTLLDFAKKNSMDLNEYKKGTSCPIFIKKAGNSRLTKFNSSNLLSTKTFSGS